MLAPGRAALSDVVAEVDRLPDALRGAMGAIACVGEALPPRAHRELLESAGLRVVAEEDRSADAIAMADRITDRLRGAKIVGLDGMIPVEGGARAALELVSKRARRSPTVGSATRCSTPPARRAEPIAMTPWSPQPGSGSRSGCSERS